MRFATLFILAMVTACSRSYSYDHIVVVIEENRARQQIIGSVDAPYINSLVKRGALFTESYAVTHPSLPNYLALFSGSTQDVADNTCPPSGAPFTTANIGQELIDAGQTFIGYSEDLPAAGSTACSYGGNAGYQRKHNPWSYFSNVPTASNQPFSAFSSDFATLPSLAFVVPNQTHDMHDGTIAQADTWLHDHLGAYAEWAMTHNSLLVITFDEDDGSANNQIATFFFGAWVRAGIYDTHIDHYDLLRTLEDLRGLKSHAGKAAVATRIEGWGGSLHP
ncbi:MAG: alkaline phosphatase family protein [Gammaproteobacteria bacterium]